MLTHTWWIPRPLLFLCFSTTPRRSLLACCCFFLLLPSSSFALPLPLSFFLSLSPCFGQKKRESLQGQEILSYRHSQTVGLNCSWSTPELPADWAVDEVEGGWCSQATVCTTAAYRHTQTHMHTLSRRVFSSKLTAVKLRLSNLDHPLPPPPISPALALPLPPPLLSRSYHILPNSRFLPSYLNKSTNLCFSSAHIFTFNLFPSHIFSQYHQGVYVFIANGIKRKL